VAVGDCADVDELAPPACCVATVAEAPTCPVIGIPSRLDVLICGVPDESDIFPSVVNVGLIGNLTDPSAGPGSPSTQPDALAVPEFIVTGSLTNPACADPPATYSGVSDGLRLFNKIPP